MRAVTTNSVATCLIVLRLWFDRRRSSAGRQWSESRTMRQTRTARCVWQQFARTATLTTHWSTGRDTTAGSCLAFNDEPPTIPSFSCCMYCVLFSRIMTNHGHAQRRASQLGGNVNLVHVRSTAAVAARGCSTALSSKCGQYHVDSRVNRRWTQTFHFLHYAKIRDNITIVTINFCCNHNDVSNSGVCSRTGQPPITTLIKQKRLKLPDRHSTPYSLRERSHVKTLYRKHTS